MGCISPSQNISVIPQYDKAQTVIVIEEIDPTNLENEISASEPETPRTGRTDRLTIGPIKKDNSSNIHRKLSNSISKILNPLKKYKHKSEIRCNGMYKSSSSELEFEIKELESSTTNYNTKYDNYKCSTSEPLSLTEINGINASSDSDHEDDFESITKLTNTNTNIGSITDNMSQQTTTNTNTNNKISPRLSLKLKQLVEPKYNPINKHYNAKWNVENPFYHSEDGIEYDTATDTTTVDTGTTGTETTVSELSSINNYNSNFYQLQLNGNGYSHTPIPKSCKSKSNKSKSIKEIKPHRIGDKIKIKSKSKLKLQTKVKSNTNQQQFYRIKQKQLPLKSPKRDRKKSAVSSSYNSLQAHHDAQSVIDRNSIRSVKSIRESNTNISTNGIINGVLNCDDDDSSSSNEFEDDATIHLPHNSVRVSSNGTMEKTITNDRITNITNGRITNITESNDTASQTSDGQPPPLPIKYLQTDSNTHYNYYYFDSNEKQKCYQIPLQRPCPPPHEFNAYSNTRTHTRTQTCDNDNHGWNSDNSTHV